MNNYDVTGFDLVVKNVVDCVFLIFIYYSRIMEFEDIFIYVSSFYDVVVNC